MYVFLYIFSMHILIVQRINRNFRSMHSSIKIDIIIIIIYYRYVIVVLSFVDSSSCVQGGHCTLLRGRYVERLQLQVLYLSQRTEELQLCPVCEDQVWRGKYKAKYSMLYYLRYKMEILRAFSMRMVQHLSEWNYENFF